MQRRRRQERVLDAPHAYCASFTTFKPLFTRRDTSDFPLLSFYQKREDRQEKSALPHLQQAPCLNAQRVLRALLCSTSHAGMSNQLSFLLQSLLGEKINKECMDTTLHKPLRLMRVTHPCMLAYHAGSLISFFPLQSPLLVQYNEGRKTIGSRPSPISRHVRALLFVFTCHTGTRMKVFFPLQSTSAYSILQAATS